MHEKTTPSGYLLIRLLSVSLLVNKRMRLKEFIKLDVTAQAELILDKGVMVDGFIDGDNTTQIYYYSDYFVELTFSFKSNKLDIIPFISGYKKEKYPILGAQN